MESGKELDDLAHRVIGAAIEVHREPGAWLHGRRVQGSARRRAGKAPHPSGTLQAQVEVVHHGRRVGVDRLVLPVAGVLAAVLKTVERLLPIHKAQLLSCLKSARLQPGLLTDFNVGLLRKGIQRVILTQ